MTSERPTDKCAVCNDVSNVYSYGLFLCRACLAFFKRSNGRMHICRRQNNCDISQDGLRTSCRACRLRKCYEVGMTVDDGDQALTNIATNLSQSLNMSPTVNSTISPAAVTDQRRGAWAVDSNSSVTFHGERPNANTGTEKNDNSLLRKLVSDFQHVRHAQKSMFAMAHPESVFAEAKYIAITKDEWKRMETGTLSLVFSMLSETLVHFGVNEQEHKTAVLSSFVMKYSTIFCSFLSTQVYPDPEDNRIATHYGYYISADTMKEYYQGEERTADKEKYARVLIPVLVTARQCISKMSRLQVREIEIAGLVGVMLWEQLERMKMLTKDAEHIRERMYSEFHDDITSHYGLVQGGARVVKILCLIEDIGELIASFKEMELIAKIFDNDNYVYENLENAAFGNGLLGND